MLASYVPVLSPPLGAFAFLSPYLWFYARDLWDNSFAIPFSVMLLATYVGFHATDRFRWLAASGLFAVLCLLTHLMTLPLIGAVVLHFLVCRRRHLRSSRSFALRATAVGVVCALATAPYLVQLSAGSATNLLWSPSVRSILFAFDGFRIFTLVGFDYVIGSWEAGGAGPVLRVLSAMTYPVAAFGLYRLNTLLRERSPWSADSASDPRTTQPDAPTVPPDAPTAQPDQAADATGAEAGVLAIALVLFVILANGKRLAEHPHYYSGVWIVFFCVWWLGMSALVRWARARRLWCGQVVAMAVFLPGLASWLHVNHGTRSLHYGPTLANQMAVARELDRLGVEGVPPSQAHHPRLFPQAIRVLRRLDASYEGDTAEGDGREGAYEIRYADPDGTSGEIRVFAMAPPR